MPGADLMTSFNDYCGLIINQFAHVYAAYYDADFKETVEHIESAKSKLAYIEVKAKEKGYPLYLIIDEYDNFTNVILSEHGQRMFHDLTTVKSFYLHRLAASCFLQRFHNSVPSFLMKCFLYKHD